MSTEVVATRRRIIRRPRLTKLLDESPARIKLLIAPAGYGKTTLAQEWLSEPKRQDVWYRGGPAAADVAALAAGLAIAASDVLPDAGKRMRERLRATGHPEEDVEILAELFAEDLQRWPENAWVAFDDYHCAMESAASERFVDLVTEQTRLQLVVTSRRRPTWATARRILYGEIHEIDWRSLTMEPNEAAAVLGRRPDDVRGLLELAKGWPAVIGLAALTQNQTLPSKDISTLEEFFSEEVLQSLEPRQLDSICVLALPNTVTDGVATWLLGDEATSVVENACDLGIFSRGSAATYSINPLLQSYLRKMAYAESSTSISEQAIELVSFYISTGAWDEAFDVARVHAPDDAIPRVVGAALDALLSEGRLATLTRWLDHAFSLHISDPVLDLAEAEVAFRLNDHRRAEQLAAQAAEAFTDSPFLTRALLRAGYAAVLASRESEARAYFRRARDLAVTVSDKREALLGEYYVASELGDRSAPEALVAAYALNDRSPEGQLRIEVMRLMDANRRGGLTEALSEACSRLHLVSRVRDPLVTTAFWHALSSALSLAGRYDEALAASRQILREAERFRLELPIPHALADKAIAELGLRRFDRVLRTLNRAQQASSTKDPYLDAIATLVRAKLFLAQHNFEQALGALGSIGRTGLSPPVHAEEDACRALALAKLGRFGEARASLGAARENMYTSIEARVLVAGVELLCASSESPERAKEVSQLWQLVCLTGNVDSFVCLYRSAPELLAEIVRSREDSSDLVQLLDRLGELSLAEKVGLRIDARAVNLLTPREQEVADLMIDGLSNQEIAAQLFISQATVKVHLRHIYEKLGVRGRTAAILKLR
jgi:ATP/maltotriose-dependent transcriptional regulator MalT